MSGQRRAAVLGSPIEHSLSPVLHLAAYRSLGLDWRYDAIEVTPEQLPPFLAALDESWVGLSLTMPLKRTVLDLLVTRSQLVETVGAANTVLLDSGCRHGENTDVAGIIQALNSIETPAGPALVLGAGATARSAVAALAQLCMPEVVVAARRPESAAGVIEVADRLELSLRVVSWPEQLPGREATPVVVSTVPAAATEGLLGALPEHPGWLLDVSYHPWPSQLAERWQAGGGRAVGGAEMLLAQAVEQVRLMTGQQPDEPAMRQALSEALARRAAEG